MFFLLFRCTLITLGSSSPLLKTVSNRSLISYSFRPTFDIFFPNYSSLGMYCLYWYLFFPSFGPSRTLPLSA